jgi:predicted phage terminase large subunit-like protein
MLKLSNQQLEALEEQASQELARRDFSYFMDYDSDFRDVDGKHLDLLDNTLMKVSEGTLKRVIVTMPPRKGKSERVSKKFPAWHVGKYPEDEIIISSYSLDLSRDFSVIARDTFKKHGGSTFEHEISSSKQSGESWGIEGHRGGVNAAGVGGSITGKGARIAIIDDPVKNSEEANSEVMREKVWQWYETTLLTRLTPDGRIVVVMTRWHEDDLVGRLLKKEQQEIREGNHVGERWTVVNMPEYAEEGDLLGRALGEPIWPEFGFTKEVMEKKRQEVGGYTWNALYQQRPSAAGGTIFKRIHFRYFREEMIGNANYFIVGDRKYLKRECEFVFQTVDTANSEKTINDYFAVATFYVTPNNDILLYDVYRTHITGPDQKPLMREQNNRYRPRFQAIEDKTFGTNLIQECKREGMTIFPVKVDKDKITRSLPIAARYEVGKVFHREATPWLTDFEDELLSFPRGKHDDQVDCMSMAGELVHSMVHDNTPWNATSDERDRKHFDLDSDEDDAAEENFW